MTTRPLIGCATYRKTISQDQPIEVYGLMPSYIEAVQAAGGLPILIPLGLDKDELQALLPRLDGILLPGGGDMAPGVYGGDAGGTVFRDVDDTRDWTEMLLVRHAVDQQKPLLAICRGIQVLNVALGGTLWEDVYQHMPDAIVHDYFHLGRRDHLAHDVTVAGGSRLAEAFGESGPIPVNSLHHQGIRSLATSLTVSATAPDGLAEAVEVANHPFAVGVQWHPENLLEREPRMRRLFQAFVAAA